MNTIDIKSITGNVASIRSIEEDPVPSSAIQEFLANFATASIRTQMVRDRLRALFNTTGEVGKLHMNSETWLKIARVYCRDEADTETDLATLRAGKYGNLWGAEVWVIGTMPDGSKMPDGFVVAIPKERV